MSGLSDFLPEIIFLGGTITAMLVIGGGAVMLERWRKTRRNRSSEYRAPKGRSWAQWRHNMRRLFSGLFWRDHYLKVVIPLGLGLVVWAALRLGGVLSQMTDGILGHLGQAISWGQADNVRSYTYALVALLGLLTLAANIPFRLIRVWTNERDTLAREEGLITDRIAKAVEGLGAEKTVKVIVTGEDGASETEERTEPNIEVRLGAIYALERIAQDSARDHVQVMEILCAYLRQNSPAEKAAKDPALSEFPSYPENASKEAVGDWREKIETWRKELGTALAEIPKPRQDLQVAITVLSRRRAKRRCQEGIYDRKGNWQGYRLDLRETDLRKFDLGKGHFDHANFSGANLQGAKLVGAEMQGANLSEARMQRADLQWAEMQGADLEGVEMQGADLQWAEMQGADLRGAEMQGADLRGAEMQGANLRGVEMQGANLSRAKMKGADLRGAEMQGANLRGVEMQGAKLSRAKMKGANLSEAEMKGANLSEAEIKSANWAGVAY